MSSKKFVALIISIVLLLFIVLLIILNITAAKGERFIEYKDNIIFAAMDRTDITYGISLGRGEPSKELTDKEKIQEAVKILSNIKVRKITRDKVSKNDIKPYSITFGRYTPQGHIIIFNDGTFIFEDVKVYEKMSRPNALYQTPENLYISKGTEIDKLNELKKLFGIDF